MWSAPGQVRGLRGHGPLLAPAPSPLPHHIRGKVSPQISTRHSIAQWHFSVDRSTVRIPQKTFHSGRTPSLLQCSCFFIGIILLTLSHYVELLIMRSGRYLRCWWDPDYYKVTPCQDGAPPPQIHQPPQWQIWVRVKTWQITSQPRYRHTLHVTRHITTLHYCSDFANGENEIKCKSKRKTTPKIKWVIWSRILC